MYQRIATVLLFGLTIAFFVVVNHLHYGDLHLAVNVPPEIATGNDAVKDEFLILLEQGQEGMLPALLSKYNLRLVAPLGEWMLVARAGAKQERAVNENFLNLLESDPAIHKATLNYVLPADDFMVSCAKSPNPSSTKLPHDSYIKSQWHLSEKYGIDAPGAWAITTGNPKIVVAAVDRFFLLDQTSELEHCPTRNYFYEDLLAYFPLKPEMLEPNNDHGAHVFSVLASCTDNGSALASVDWHAQMFAIDTKANASLAARMLGLLWAAGENICSNTAVPCPKGFQPEQNHHPAHVINASFGFGAEFLKAPPYGPILDLIGRINRTGRVLVASAGNEGVMADRRLPGAAGGAISVGASTKKQQSAAFSNFGRTIDVVAPGENILGWSGKNLLLLNGTSFSAPLVTGVVSLMLDVNPVLSWKAIEHILKQTATRMTCQDYCPQTMKAPARLACQNYCCHSGTSHCASGIVNAKRAVAMAKAGIPDVALIDVDDYYVPLGPATDFKASVILKNWGKKSAIVRLKITDPYLKTDPEVLMLGPASPSGEPALGTVQLIYDRYPTEAQVLSLIFEAASSDKPERFHDRIEAIVDLNPDDAAKRRYLNELPPPNR